MQSEKIGVPSRKVPSAVIALGVVSFLTDASSEMIYPLIPVFVAALGSGAFVLGAIEGAAESTASLLKLVTGIVSDRVRRRKVFVLCGYGISGLARPLIALVTQSWLVMPIRMADRVGKGLRTAPRDALIAAAVDEKGRGRAFGFHRAMDHAGAVVGPLLALGSLMILFVVFGVNDPIPALRITFGLALIPGILAFVVLLVGVRESRTHAVAQDTRSAASPLDRNFFAYLATLTLFTLGNSSDAFLLYRISEALSASGEALTGHGAASELLVFLRYLPPGIPPDLIVLPFVWAFFHIIKVVFSTPFGSLSDRIGRRYLIGMGWTVYAFVYLGFAFLDMVPRAWQMHAVLGLFGVYALHYALTEGVEKAFVADLAPLSASGTAFGWYNFCVGIAALPASLIFGFIYETAGARVAFLWGALLAVLALVALGLFVRPAKAHRT